MFLLWKNSKSQSVMAVLIEEMNDCIATNARMVQNQEEYRKNDMILLCAVTRWGSLLDYLTVYKKDDIRFTFKDGTEIKV